MKINAINSDYNTNFNGSIDKSFVKYVKKVQKDVIKNYPPNSKYVAYVNETAPKILEKLDTFMKKTSPDTTLVLSKHSKQSHINKDLYYFFVNTKTNESIAGAHEAYYGGKDYMGFKTIGKKVKILNETVGIYTNEWPQQSVGFFAHIFNKLTDFCDTLQPENLKRIDKWASELVKDCDPKDIDKMLTLKANQRKWAGIPRLTEPELKFREDI
ncbi:MAG: hypothetical protein E7Z87_02475 [Cyanobacteria bacterium SIG26]|nr:hypothetical protein [Cyanobacteria bacterium SIG26]